MIVKKSGETEKFFVWKRSSIKEIIENIIN